MLISLAFSEFPLSPEFPVEFVLYLQKAKIFSKFKISFV